MAARQAVATLMRGSNGERHGWPCVRQKRAIDEGAIKGPRIYPSGAMISQTKATETSVSLSSCPARWAESSYPRIGCRSKKSQDEVRLRTREQLRQGASQIKLKGGGGVSSQYNPIELTQFSEAEIHAAVEVRKMGPKSHTRVYATCNPQGHRSRCQMHRTWPTHRRANRQGACR